MVFLSKKDKERNGEKRKNMRRWAHSVGLAYGVKLSFNEERNVENWLLCRDPYMAELFCDG